MILHAQIRRYSGSAVLPAGPLSASAVSVFAFRIRVERKYVRAKAHVVPQVADPPPSRANLKNIGHSAENMSTEQQSRVGRCIR